MKLVYKICLTNVAIAMIASLVIGPFAASRDDYWITVGLLNLGGGFINIIISFVLFVMKRKQWAKGYLLSAAILILIGTAVCSQFVKH